MKLPPRVYAQRRRRFACQYGITYLTAAVRAHRNLTISGGAEVDKVVIEGKRTVGLELDDGEVLPAGEIILAAGTLGKCPPRTSDLRFRKPFQSSIFQLLTA
jgi:aspartate oxidase